MVRPRCQTARKAAIHVGRVAVRAKRLFQGWATLARSTAETANVPSHGRAMAAWQPVAGVREARTTNHRSGACRLPRDNSD
jgi:hypothetical protein